MPLSRAAWAGIAATVLWTLASIYFFVQYKDPMILVFAAPMIVAIWTVVLIVHILRHGIPVRVVGKE